jgi:hypothetical protein
MRVARVHSQAGFSLIEVLISSAIMIGITGAIFSLVTPAQGTSEAQPEVADLQQRTRVGSEVLFKELVMAGAGPYQGATSGSLINYFAPILPRRTGRISPDLFNRYRSDAITLSYIPNTYSQTTLSSSMPDVSAELKVHDQSNCPRGQQLCGFTEGMEVLIFDSSGNFDTFSITEVQNDAGHLQHRGQDLNHEYQASTSTITQVESNTYYLDRQNNQLRKYDGDATDLPLVDNVVDLRFEYFGDPNPPTKPKPAAGESNCLYDAAGNLTGLPVLAPDEGSLVRLTEAMLTDGPWCGGGSNKFDADLLRMRKVRVTMRMQVGSSRLRGADTQLFVNPGTSLGGERFVPDYSVAFEVSPRNLNLSR